MDIVTQRGGGLFPKPAEIKMKCSCPDWAGMCKHVAAVMYGVGTRLDNKPELLFLLRKVDHLELIAGAVDSSVVVGAGKARGKKTIAAGDLADVFGIEMAEAEASVESGPAIVAKKQAKAAVAAAKTSAKSPPSAGKMSTKSPTTAAKTASEKKPKQTVAAKKSVKVTAAKQKASMKTKKTASSNPTPGTRVKTAARSRVKQTTS